MALYRITVAGEAPLWPDLAKFNGKERKTRPAAFNDLYAAIYEAAEGDGALDTQRAHEARAWVHRAETSACNAPGLIASHDMGRFSFSIERVR